MVFLDANVILEIILKDRPNFERAKQSLEKITDETVISMLTVHLIMHFGRKAGIADELLERVIGENEIISVIPEDYVWAVLNERGSDFEDALQVATAIRNHCDSFMTFDTSLAKAYSDFPVEIIVP